MCKRKAWCAVIWNALKCLFEALVRLAARSRGESELGSAVAGFDPPRDTVVLHRLAQVRRLLDFVGVPFDEACLEHHRTERTVRTPSSEQVRQPIYTRGLDYWRNYESSLAGLKTSLAPQLDEYQGLLDTARGRSAQNT